MHILIVGDSWSNGAYGIPGCPEPTMPGLEYFLSQRSNHRVTNISVRGGGNQYGIDLVHNFVKHHEKPDLIIFMQCSFMRDYKNYFVDRKVGWAYETVRDGCFNDALNWNSPTIDTIIEPNFTRIALQLQNFTCPMIVVGGNTKFHNTFKQFPGVHKSFSQVAVDDFEDSYFDNRLDLEIFAKCFLKKSELPNQEKYDVVDKEFEKFIKKINKWESQSLEKFFNCHHATAHLHFKLYEEVCKILDTL